MINDVVFWPRLLVPELVLSDAERDDVVVEAVETMIARYGSARFAENA
jgi:TetR/AcrR family transcriptional regulator, regulator of autoinduction and epiphytic fitness